PRRGDVVGRDHRRGPRVAAARESATGAHAQDPPRRRAMGERGNGMNQAPELPEDGGSASAGEAGPEPRKLEQEIESVRSELGDLVGELDRRRRDALDWRLQARRHPTAVVIVCCAGLLIAGSIVVWSARRLRSDTALERGQKLAHALAIAAR